jgi:hypothetical protein
MHEAGVVTDKDKIDLAFADLSTRGFAAHADFTCCQSCGLAKLADDTLYAFYHWQDAEALDEAGDIQQGRRLRIAYGETVEAGQQVVAALQRAGLRVEWNGSLGRRIEVLPSRVM